LVPVLESAFEIAVVEEVVVVVVVVSIAVELLGLSLPLFIYANMLAIADTCCCTASAADRAKEVEGEVGIAAAEGSEEGNDGK
jgi:hypothetical protein